MNRIFKTILATLLLAVTFTSAVDLPAPPVNHFTDNTGTLSADQAAALNTKLTQFERDTSIQFVVACFDKLPDDMELRDYSVALARHWKIGLKDKNNGLALFWFKGSRKIDIEIGYGLEGKVPDAIAARIRLNDVTPLFKQGQFAEGLNKGVDSLILACKGEYQGTGQTVADGDTGEAGGHSVLFWIVVVVIIIIVGALAEEGGGGYGGGGGYSGGSSGSSGGGSFSGGGGSFGGGGSGGSYRSASKLTGLTREEVRAVGRGSQMDPWQPLVLQPV